MAISGILFDVSNDVFCFFFFSSRRRHTRSLCDWSSDVCSSDLLLWHGGGLTGVTYETTPDGREGWLTYFLRRGWDVYNSDAVERGRAGWAMYPDILQGEPVFLTKENPWERFRIGGPGSYSEGPAQRKALPGSQFPVEGYENFVKQVVPRWTTTDPAITAAYTELVDKVCP